MIRGASKSNTFTAWQNLKLVRKEADKFLFL